MTQADVAIIGGGPAGAALGILLARAGSDVALFEKQTFPRFHVGESLVPAVNLTLDKLGVLDRLDERRFPRKHGVQFYSQSGPGRPFYFSEVEDPRLHHTWQVLRSDFDDLLLGEAREAGVRIQTRAEVRGVLESNGAVEGLRFRREDGSEDVFRAKVVVDASGQRGLLAKSLGNREHLDGLDNVSFWAHYEGVTRDSGVDAGSTLIFRLDHQSWLWFIPLPDVVSIGLVTPAGSIPTMGRSRAEVLDQAVAACAPLQDRLASARRSTQVHAIRDVSYRARHDGGKGWALVGDALGFIDPIYSTGLFLTMFSAELAAEAISNAIANGRDLAGYSADYQAAFDRFLALVRAYYSPDFHFGQLAKVPAHRQGLIDLLTGLVNTPEAIEVTRVIGTVPGTTFPS